MSTRKVSPKKRRWMPRRVVASALLSTTQAKQDDGRNEQFYFVFSLCERVSEAIDTPDLHDVCNNLIDSGVLASTKTSWRPGP